MFTSMTQKKRILLIEDEEDIADLIKFNLEQAGFEMLVLSEGRHILPQIRQFKADLVILDLMLPDIDGLDICKRLKKDTLLQKIPVVMVTAKGTETDRIVGLELGADDYIVKPFSPRELVLRIKAVLARAYPQIEQTKETIIEDGEISIDLQKHLVVIDGEPLDLTATEFKLLYELMSNKGKVRTREILLDRVWGYTFDGYARTVDTHIRRLRKKLDKYADNIETIRSIGYRYREHPINLDNEVDNIA